MPETDRPRLTIVARYQDANDGVGENTSPDAQTRGESTRASQPVAETPATVIRQVRLETVGPKQPPRLPADFTPDLSAAVHTKPIVYKP